MGRQHGTTLIYVEQGRLAAYTFLSDAQTADLADWIATTVGGCRRSHHSRASLTVFFRVETFARSLSFGSRACTAAGGREHAEVLTPDSVASWNDDFQDRYRIVSPLPKRSMNVPSGLRATRSWPWVHTDTDHTTCLHVPSIGLVVVVMPSITGRIPIVESDRQGLNEWLAAIDKIEDSVCGRCRARSTRP